MPDSMDRVQQAGDDHVADSLKRHASTAQQRPGREHCANLECGEPITDVRRALGAQLCMPCQQDEDAETRAHARTFRAGR